MSGETLRRAAVEARRMGTAPAALGPDFNDPIHLAVADLLDHCARSYHPNFVSLRHDHAFTVARAYLGESA